MISLYRIDDRVIHGQTMVQLLPKYPSDGVIIIDDGVYANKNLLTLYSQVLMGNVKLYCYSIELALNKLKEAENSKKKYIIIFKSISTVVELFKKGYSFTDVINVGTASRKEDARDIIKGFALNDIEIEAYNYLDDNGVKFNIIPMGGVSGDITWSSLRKKV